MFQAQLLSEAKVGRVDVGSIPVRFILLVLSGWLVCSCGGSHCPSVPGALTQAIRNFAKSLESWLTNAMMNIPEEMVRVKVRCGGAVQGVGRCVNPELCQALISSLCGPWTAL